MVRYLFISALSGLLFGVLDGILNGNPLARKLLGFYQPISRQSLNIGAGIVIDLVYGFVLAGLFILLFPSLPGKSGIMKGFSFALIVWFLRVGMNLLSQWMMYRVPAFTLGYLALAGLFEMLVLGTLYGLTLKP